MIGMETTRKEKFKKYQAEKTRQEDNGHSNSLSAQPQVGESRIHRSNQSGINRVSAQANSPLPNSPLSGPNLNIVTGSSVVANNSAMRLASNAGTKSHHHQTQPSSPLSANAPPPLSAKKPLNNPTSPRANEVIPKKKKKSWFKRLFPCMSGPDD
jgi:hypothetical protein